MKLNRKVIGFFLAGLVFLPGCIRVPIYKSKPLGVFQNSCTYTDAKKGITVSAKLLNRAESSYIFDGRIESDRDIKIIYLSIYNLSSRDYSLSSEEISLSHLSYENIVEDMRKTSSIGRLSGAVAMKALSYGHIYVAQGFFAIPSGIAIALGAGVTILSFVPYVMSLAFLGSGIKSMIMNRRMHHDLQDKIVDKEVIIESGDKYEGLIFMKSGDYESRFNVALTEQYHPNNKIVFGVNLLQASHTDEV